MSDSIEKIYCCDRGYNNDPLAMAAMMGRNGGFGNNFAELFVLLLATRMFGGFGFGGFGEGGFGFGQGQQNIEMQNQLQAIRTQLQDNQNLNCLQRAVDGNAADLRQLSNTLNCDFNTLQQCCCDLKQAMATIGGQIGYSKEAVINAVNSGDCQVIQAIKDCCCTTQKELIQMAGDIKLQNCQQTGELRNGQRDLGQAITQGFAQSSYETKSQTCEIIQAINEAQRKTNDLLTGHWSNEQAREIQDLKNEISQLKQTEAITAAVMSRVSHLGGNNCGCGCNNGCSF